VTTFLKTLVLEYQYVNLKAQDTNVPKEIYKTQNICKIQKHQILKVSLRYKSILKIGKV